MGNNRKKYEQISVEITVTVLCCDSTLYNCSDTTLVLGKHFQFQSVLELSGGGLNPPPQFMSTDVHF